MGRMAPTALGMASNVAEDQEVTMSTPDFFPRTLHIGILVFDGFEPIDVWGFTEAFTISRFIGTA